MTIKKTELLLDFYFILLNFPDAGLIKFILSYLGLYFLF